MHFSGSIEQKMNQKLGFLNIRLIEVGKVD